MKGIILSGGHGTRLYPLTKITSKQLLPVYDKPMVMYPLQTLIDGGIKDILVIIAPDYEGLYKKLLGNGSEFGVNITFKIQDKPDGLAQAFIIGEEFIGNDNVAMILGDNIFFAEGGSTSGGEDMLAAAIKNFKSGGHIFAKKVEDPERYGVVRFDEKMNAVEIEEKPKTHISDYAITGLYIYDNNCISAAKNAKPSARGEYEITEIHNWYLAKNELKVDIINGQWLDAGTFESLFQAGELARLKALKK
jgi:glucose-1-phosphate thymidylyltransferase